MKRTLTAAVVLLLTALLWGCAGEAPEPVTEPAQPVMATEAAPETLPTTVPTQPEPERFALTFVGDCTLGASLNNFYARLGFIKTVGEDYAHPFRNVITWFEEDEASFVNLEGPLTDQERPQEKRHVFRGPTSYIRILTENSVECVSLANNHTLDHGRQGYASTVSLLEEAGIPFVERDSTRIFTTENGLTIGLYGAVYYHLDVEDMVQKITWLEERCDLVIYAPHWGTEGTYQPTQEQLDVGHAAIDAGADIVWGSHPHVLQPIEHYNGGVIFYSLGNFAFGGNACPKDFDTALLQQEVLRHSDGTVTLGELTVVPACVSSVEKTNNYQPTPYEPGSEGYERVLQKLAGTFSGTGLKNG